MKGWQFDVEQFRKNWDRPPDPPKRAPSAPAPPPTAEQPAVVAPEQPQTPEPPAPIVPVEPLRRELPRKFAKVEAPSDPYAAARDLMKRVRGYARADIGKHEATLAPFFAEAEELIERLEKGPDRKALRPELDRVLGDLEDMLALFSGIGR